MTDKPDYVRLAAKGEAGDDGKARQALISMTGCNITPREGDGFVVDLLQGRDFSLHGYTILPNETYDTERAAHEATKAELQALREGVARIAP